MDSSRRGVYVSKRGVRISKRGVQALTSSVSSLRQFSGTFAVEYDRIGRLVAQILELTPGYRCTSELLKCDRQIISYGCIYDICGSFDGVDTAFSAKSNYSPHPKASLSSLREPNFGLPLLRSSGPARPSADLCFKLFPAAGQPAKYRASPTNVGAPP